MTINQISVFLENKSGRLAEVTRLLGDGGVNLRALTIADTADFGILRLIADDLNKALKILEDGGFTARVTEVIGVEVSDKPGGLAKVLDIFSKRGVNIEYIYASLERNKENAIIIFKVEDIDKGTKVLEENKFKIVSTW
ncbi:MAG TPA: ACT domain-containing protein [Spirochaetia bacterium]|nr:ACT domain-containing protein [Spirochaetia bacterium]